MKRAVIIGATSGIGEEVANLLLSQGWHIGIAGRRSDRLEAFRLKHPDKIVTETIDVTHEAATEGLLRLIQKLGGMDLFLLSSGIGRQNKKLDPSIELTTVQTNTMGFTRMVTTAYHYFKDQGNGHLAVISSIAGTKGLGTAPAYSATKRFQNTYIEALQQLAYMEKLNIRFTDIRPGFVATDLLSGEHHYPLLMEKEKVAKRLVGALLRHERVVIIDWRYRLIVFFWRLIPAFLWRRLPIKTRK